MHVFAISNYKDPIRSLILAKRRSDILASYELAQLICDFTVFSQIPADHIIPIPLHWTRYARRGFNQAEEMAKFLAKQRNIPMTPMLTRVKKTKFQAGLDANERQSNVEQAFRLVVKNTQQYRGKHLILVDDLMTTGSTFQSAARVLLDIKPATISGIVAARVI
jgi:competence protein ComFC